MDNCLTFICSQPDVVNRFVQYLDVATTRNLELVCKTIHFTRPCRLLIGQLEWNQKTLPFHKHINRNKIQRIKGVTNARYLPTNVCHITFDDSFNGSFYCLSTLKNLTHLTFGENFNGPIDVCLLLTQLTHIVFGDSFNRQIDVLESLTSLIHIRFGRCFVRVQNTNCNL